jgi:hypothetical protein
VQRAHSLCRRPQFNRHNAWPSVSGYAPLISPALGMRLPKSPVNSGFAHIYGLFLKKVWDAAQSLQREFVNIRFVTAMT